jgi:hypothetical protein
MTTPHVHCMSNLPTAHEPHTPDGAEGDRGPDPVNRPSDPVNRPSDPVSRPSDPPVAPTAGDEWGDGRVPARVAPMSLRPLG